MPALHFAIATIPVAVYILLIGALRLRRHPLVTTGWRDMLTLGIAASGFVAIGPMQLFYPNQAASRWHAWVWLALFLLYLLALMLLMLSAKPRLIVYGMDERQFQASLLEAARQIDPDAAWNGDVIDLPQCGIQLAREPSGATRVQQVVHVGMLHNIQDWLRLEKSLVAVGAKTRCAPSMAGWPFVIAGTLLLALATTPLMSDPGKALAQLRQFLDR